MTEEHDDYDEAIRQINRSGARWLLLGILVLLVGSGGFVWLMTLEPDYDNVTCNGRPMGPGDECTIVTRTPTVNRNGTVSSGATRTLSYEEMAEPALPGSMGVWVSVSLAVTGIGIWMSSSTIKGWRSDLREERRIWGFPDDGKEAATSPEPDH